MAHKNLPPGNTIWMLISQFTKHVHMLVLFWLLLLCYMPTFSAERYAIIIGVSEYPNLDKALSLVGPSNDAFLLRSFLQDQAFADDYITMLTDDRPEDQLPTKRNIIAAIESTLERSQDGDFVYLHFSGHGSQEPAESTDDELDGLNEIFLPRDTGSWNRKVKHVENAISDNVISTYLRKFRKKGVFVWLVFDSCHSGSMTRSQWQGRKVKASDLGIPTTRSTVQDKNSPIHSLSTTDDTGYVAFFAAQTTEETPEMKLPVNAKIPKVYGLFTFNLIQAIASNPSATYRQLADQIVQNYMAHPWYGSVPVFVGGGLDRPILGADETTHGKVIRQWIISRSDSDYEISAGYLHGINAGARLAVLNRPTDDTDNAIGYVTVEDSQPAFSTLAIGESEDLALRSLDDIPELAYARLIDPGIALGLTVSALTGDNIKSTEHGNKVIAKIKEDMSEMINWVNPAQPADFRILDTGKALVLLSDGETLPCAYGDCNQDTDRKKYIKVPLTGSIVKDALALSKNLQVIAKALNLIRLGTVLGGDGLATSLEVKRAKTGINETFDVTEVPTLYEGDSLSLKVANYLEEPLDITVLFVGSDYSIDVVFPRNGKFNRFMEEEETTIELGKINVDTTGVERLIILSSIASKGSAAVNYNFLAQSGLVKRRNARKAGSLDALLDDAGFSQANIKRRSIPVEESINSKGDIHTLSWITSERP